MEIGDVARKNGVKEEDVICESCMFYTNMWCDGWECHVAPFGYCTFWRKKQCESEKGEEKMSFDGWVRTIHNNAVEHGWWEDPRTFGEIVALCHSELSEALEAYRANEEMVWVNNGKPDGIAVEMVDCVIRIFDWFGSHPELNFEEILTLKHEYNRTRPYKHGGKRI